MAAGDERNRAVRSPYPPDERDLDVAGLRRATPQVTAARKGRRSQRGIGRYLIGGVVALVLLLFGSVVWFAYQDLMPGGNEAPPLIRADAAPIKREPDERGGLPLVNAESAVVQALEEPDSPVRVERIVPRESVAPRSTADVIPERLEADPVAETETAVADVGPAATTAGGEAEVGTDSLETLLAEIVEGQGDPGAVEPASGTAASDAAAADEPAALPVPSDGLPVPEAAVTALATDDGDITTLPAESPAPAASVTATAPATGTPPAVQAPPRAASPPAASPPVAAAPAPEAPPAPPRATLPETTVAALPQPALAPSFAGAYGVQLLAVRDEAAAAGAWADLQQQYPGVLGQLQSRVQRADIGGNTFYRLQAGPFADRASASTVCSALQARGADCFIVEPAS
jgi:cell division protein FtsN